MFLSKQSDYWFKEDTREFLVCAITSVSATGPACKGPLIAHYPAIYSIDKKTNVKRLVFPNDVDSISGAQLTDENAPGYVYSFVPEVSADINLSEISKPVITYNEKTDFYNITYLGRYTDSTDGFTIFTYTFQYVDEFMYPVYSRAIVPESKHTSSVFNYTGSNLHKDYFIQGNSTEGIDSFYGLNVDERPPNYKLRPMHKGNDILFNTALFTLTSTDVTATSSLPFGHSGGFIAKKKETASYKTDEYIRVDFTCKSYSLSGADQKGLISTRSSNSTAPLTATRSIKQYTLSAGPAEGFCVFFYTPSDTEELELDGVNSSMGYCPSDSNQFEVGGFPAFETKGINLSGYVGVAFDLAGNFTTMTEGKPSAYDGTTFTQVPCSIGVRAGDDNNYVSLGRSSAITSVPLHETVSTASAAVYKDFRVELTKKSKTVIVSGKLSTDSTYTELYRINLNKSNFNFTTPKVLKAGLTCTTSTSVFNFELKSFRIQGVADK